MKTLIFGKLHSRSLLDNKGQFINAHPSGDALFAASAAISQAISTSIVARLGRNFPVSFLEEIKQQGINIEHVRSLREDIDHRLFTSLIDPAQPRHDHPIQHFAEAKLKLPKDLLDYRYEEPHMDSQKRSLRTWRESDLMHLNERNSIAGAHLGPNDFLSHSLMPSVLRRKGIKLVTVEAGSGYMHPDFKNDLPNVLADLTAFITNKTQLTAHFGETVDHWQALERLADYGCELTIALDHFTGIDVFLAKSRQRLHIPPYPSKLVDPTFATSAFSGALIASLVKGKGLIESALNAAACMSLASESYDPFYILGSYPGLIDSRRENLALAAKEY